MKHAGKSLIIFVSILCPALLVLSVYPGLLSDLLLQAFFSSAYIVVYSGPILLIAALITVIVLAARGVFRGFRMPWKQIGIAAAIFTATGAAIVFYLPCRVAFACSRPAFDALVAPAAPSRTGGQTLNKRLGVYFVDEFATDPRGGAYFRVYKGPDGFGPDTISYGFVHQPNPDGTPFGAKGYQTYPLGGGWYWFEASDDWY